MKKLNFHHHFKNRFKRKTYFDMTYPLETKISSVINQKKIIRNSMNWIRLSFLSLGTFITVGFLFWIILDIFIKGLAHFHFSMIWKSYDPNNLNNSGFAPFLVTTLLLIILTLIIAIPIGILIAIWINEYNKYRWINEFIYFFINVFNATPSILFGMFGMAIFVVSWHLGYTGFSILAAALTLTLVILPTVILGMIQSLKNISKHQRRASFALGANESETIHKLLLPSCKKGLITTIILAISRVISESAPVYLTLGSAYFMPNGFLSQGRSLTTAIILLITEGANNNSVNFAYSIAMFIIFLLLILNITAKLIIYYYVPKNRKNSMLFVKKNLMKINNKFMNLKKRKSNG